MISSMLSVALWALMVSVVVLFGRLAALAFKEGKILDAILVTFVFASFAFFLVMFVLLALQDI